MVLKIVEFFKHLPCRQGIIKSRLRGSILVDNVCGHLLRHYAEQISLVIESARLDPYHEENADEIKFYESNSRVLRTAKRGKKNGIHPELGVLIS